MGCGASASAGQLKEARLQVGELQQKLADSEAENEKLRQKLQTHQQEVPSKEAAVENVQTTPSESSQPAAKEAENKELSASKGAASELDTTFATSKARDSSDSGTEVDANSKSEGGLCAKAEEDLPPEMPGLVISEASGACDKIIDQGTLLPGAVGESEPLLPGTVGESEPLLGGAVGVAGSSPSRTAQDDLPAVSSASPTQVDGGPMSTKESLSLETLTDQPEQQSVAPTDQPGESQPKDSQPAMSDSKLPGSGSTASTCTPNANAAGTYPPTCHQCGLEAPNLHLDASDMNRYCEQCWSEYYGRPPSRSEVQALVGVEVVEIWAEDRLAQLWAEYGLPGWPPKMMHSTPAVLSADGDDWSAVNVRIRREIVGPHAREQNNSDGHPYAGEVLAQRYRVKYSVGEGHFTKAFMAEDMREGGSVCVKRHRSLSIEALADFLVLGKRLSEQDEGGTRFPRLVDAFYDVLGYTVESLLEGPNCLSVAQSDASFFRLLKNLRHVAIGALEGLVVLERAGVVHNDVKPDNLIWTEVRGAAGQAAKPCVKIVDFGCARLDMREEPVGRNWSLAEGGAGHLGKWSPEMALRLPITHKNDIWGVAISLCELHCGRFMWRNEADTAEVILAQAIGLCGLTSGLPASLLRRSPLNVVQLYTPAPLHFPVRQNALGQLESLRPTRWGLEQVLGDGWKDGDKAGLGEFIERALVVDPVYRPSALELLEGCSFVANSDEQGNMPPP